MNLPLVLASSSIYRHNLIKQLHLDCLTVRPDIDETPKPNETPEQLVKRLALDKAQAVTQAYPNHLIISSDQASVLNGKITGKPHGFEKAFEQLQNSSGQSVHFYTSLCLYNSQTNQYQLDMDIFTVHFRSLTNQQITNYLHREQPYDCAGSFRVEGLGICLFEKLEGNDPNSLIGLPIIKLINMLEKEGVTII